MFFLSITYLVTAQTNPHLYTDTVSVTTIPEVIIYRNQTSRSEKQLKVKWKLSNHEELLSFISNDKKYTQSIRELSFRVANLSNSKDSIRLKIYSNINEKPGILLFQKEIKLSPKEEINKINFSNNNNLFKEGGVFIGFQFFGTNTKKGVFVFTHSAQTSQTFIKNGNECIRLLERYSLMPHKFTNVDIYLKIKHW